MVSAYNGSSSGVYRFHSEKVRRKSPMVVLAITDPEARRARHDHLTESGLTVVDASSLADVLPLASRFLADIAIFDLDGLGYDALTVARKLRGINDTVTIGLTRTATPSVLSFARSVGFAALLQEPCAPETLFTEILVALAAAEEEESRKSGNS
jgi:DNA-binding response OmpR family regulator